MKTHQGKLTAKINGSRYQFNGDKWLLDSMPDLANLGVLYRLNDATQSTSKTHIGILELAQLVIVKADLQDQSEITDYQQAEIQPPPDGAID